MLKFDNVSFQYDVEDFSIIDHLSFDVQDGEFVSVIGASGCGKSTIFRLVNKLLLPASGEILVDGESIEKKRNYCGYMPQQDLLFPWRTVRENLLLPMEIRGGYSKTEMREKADAALESVGLKDWGDKMPKELSGGMRQRAAFARTVLTGSDLLLLDEPFSALDYLTRISMREWLLEQWEREKKTVLFITHDVEEAVFLSSRILVVEESPITHLRSIDVPAEYPRSRDELRKPEILSLKEELIGIMSKKMKKDHARVPSGASHGQTHNFLSTNLPAAILVAALLIFWQAAAMGIDAAYILPSPTQVVVRLWELRGPLFKAHLPATMSVVGIGLLISIILGLGLAVLMDASETAEKALYPLIIASQTIPTTALAPLFVLWFGYTIWSKVLVTVLITFFPITITVFDGFKSVKTEMEELLFTFGADKRQIFMKLKVPAVLPCFFSAIKMAVPLSIIGAAIGEWLGAQSGLGYFSRRMMTQLDGAGVFAPILLLSVAAMAAVWVVTLLEKRIIHWRNE